MIKITFYWEKGILRGIETKGHSGSAESGHDVVCAAVSSLMNALILGLSEVAEIKDIDGVIDPEVPVIKIFWPRECAGDVDVLTRTIALSLKKLVNDNAEKFNSSQYVNITEVQL